MSIPTNRLHRLLGRTHDILTAFAIVAVTAALSAAAARAAEAGSPSIPARSAAATWGAGPMTTSLLEAARHEAPVRDVDHECAPELTANGPRLTLVAYPSSAIR
jgi:hypothetical protein